MKVKELVALLQGMDQEADVSFGACYDLDEPYCEDVQYDHVKLRDGAVEFNLDDFVDSVNDFNEVLAAL